MQTFLPVPDFVESASMLDNRRLGKQRVEALQILQTLVHPKQQETRAWLKHPAVLMWRGHELALCDYALAVCDEWFYTRGNRDTCQPQILILQELFRRRNAKADMPAWLGDNRLHASHRSNLLRKDPTWYGRFGWVEGPDYSYYWPVQEKYGAK